MRYLYLLLLSSCALFAQEDFKNLFESPLKIDIYSSGTFGELRNNHFHAGLDIRTQQRTGIPIYAPYQGYVSRIKVSSFGYGKALYIVHPGGLTTVYGHLESYAEPIASVVKQRHYKEESFEIELFLNSTQIKVNKGDLIGYTGNSGGSGGPHLHYEIRDTQTQKILNPLLYGMDKYIEDTLPPTVTSLYMYVQAQDHLPGQPLTATKLNYTRKGNELFVDTIFVKGQVGFGVSSFDPSNSNTAKNGLYTLEGILNDQTIFSYVFDQFAFSETRYINSILDYGIYQNTNSRVQKLFTQKQVPLSVIKSHRNDGFISVNSPGIYSYKIVLSDFNANQTIIHIPLQFSPEALKGSQAEITGVFIDSNISHTIKEGDFEIQIPKGAFYSDQVLNVKAQGSVLTLHNHTIPVHRNIEIKYTGVIDSKLQKDKVYLGRVSKSGLLYNTTEIKSSGISIKTRDLGRFEVSQDVTPPVIYKPSFKQADKLTVHDSIVVHIKDENSGINKYSGKINGKWVLFDYDYKTNKLVHLLLDGIAQPGKNSLLIEIEDKVGNKAEFESYFFF